MQISLFDGSVEFKINKPIRLIELFAGYGSQALALKYLRVEFEHWKICEWAVKSIQAYHDIHFTDDDTDYSQGHSDEFVYNRLCRWGISANYNEPMTPEQIKRLGTEKQRQIYNNIKSTHNLVNIQQTHAEDLQIVDTDNYCYIMTYSFPCQDLSSAGLGKGMEKGSGTRSGMLWEVERILDECDNLPQVLLMENVPEVIGSKNIKHFAKWLEKLESLGYHCYWEVLNAKDYGIPQNRERCFMVSILGDYTYEFPKGIKLEHKLKDLLEKEVDEKYYLSDRAIKGIENTKFNCSTLSARTEKNGIMPTLCARDYKDPKLVVEIKGVEHPIVKDTENFIQWKQKGFLDSDCRAWKDESVSGTLTTNGKNKIVETNLKRELCNKLITENLVEEMDVIRHSYTNNRLNNNVDNMKRTDSKEKLCPTLDTRCDCLGIVVKSNNKRLKSLVDKMDLTQDNQFMDIYNQTTSVDAGTITTRVDASNSTAVYTDYRIRKLTPRECFRLMGVKDEDFDKVSKNQSNASLYHLAGDSIVVDVLMAIFKEML